MSVVVNTAKTPKAATTTALAFSSGIRRIRHIEQFLNVDKVVSPTQVVKENITPDYILVWGRKSNAAAAHNYSKEQNIPVLYLEDGWIRSCSSNPHSRLSYSIQFDTTGVYYDSRSPSDLENFLNLDDASFAQVLNDEKLSYAAKCRQQLLDANITKYNYCKQAAVISTQKPLVLVIDQTLDDASVTCGGMDAKRFQAMLDAAITENPSAHIVVRTHPDVVSGRKQGYLSEYAKQLNIDINADASNPLELLKQAARVYVGTSQMGYEALLCETNVVVFGQPFYASWGLSDDRQAVERRKARRSIDQLFYATHIHQTRYVHPATGQAWQLHECIEHVKLQKRMFARNAKTFHCLGFTAWKRRYIAQFLRSPEGSVQFVSDGPSPAELDNTSAEQAFVTWSYRTHADIGPGSPQQVDNKTLLRMEDGFLRSTGLGSDFNAPASLVLDERGLYFDPSRESDLEALLNGFDCTVSDISRAVRLKKLILSARLSKYNVGTQSLSGLVPTNTPHLLVVGQVEDDESIKRACDVVNTNASLLQAVRKARPDAWIRYKPHPDVLAGNRRGRVEQSVLDECADIVDVNASIVDCIDACDELHTMSSLSGFEALLRGKKVIAYGAPFYSGWGLTEDHQTVERRTRRRTLDELIFLSLIEYPRYIDVDTGEFTTPEDLVFTINSRRAMNRKKTTAWSSRQLMKATNILRGLRYAP